MLLAFFFCNKQSIKETEILQEGFSLVLCCIKLLPDSNVFRYFLAHIEISSQFCSGIHSVLMDSVSQECG